MKMRVTLLGCAALLLIPSAAMAVGQVTGFHMGYGFYTPFGYSHGYFSMQFHYSGLGCVAPRPPIYHPPRPRPRPPIVCPWPRPRPRPVPPGPPVPPPVPYPCPQPGPQGGVNVSNTVNTNITQTVTVNGVAY